MARIIPEKVMYFNTSYGEKIIYEALQKLSDEYTIFYSIQWQQKDRKDSIVWGESDFTIFHPKKGILVIEVKSGKISLKDGKWYQTRLDNMKTHEMNSPLDQANRSKYRFIELLQPVYKIGEKCSIQSVVWFPSIEDNDFDNLPPAYTKDIILTKNDINTVSSSIENIYNYYKSNSITKLSDITTKRIINTLAPEFDLIPFVGAEKQEKEFAFLRLTREQSTLLDYLIEQRKVCIQGSAGTGKTLIAVEEAKRLATEGRKVLFLCFNHFLYKYLQNTFKDYNIDFYNLHSLLYKYTGLYNICNEQILPLLIKSESKFEYDDVIIDEGQDFNSEVIDFYSKMVEKKDGKFYVFYDKKQLLFQKENASWIENAECKLVLTKNCRNTQQIAVTSNNVIDAHTYLNDNVIQGEMPTLNFVSDKEKAIEKIMALIKEYKLRGFDNKDITILTLDTEFNSILYNCNSIGSYKFVSEIDGKNIVFTTSKKFKGLESNAIIIIDIKSNDFIDEEKKRNLYVASSRAKQKLDLVFISNDEDIKIVSDSIKDIQSTNSVAKISLKLKVKPIK